MCWKSAESRTPFREAVEITAVNQSCRSHAEQLRGPAIPSRSSRGHPTLELHLESASRHYRDSSTSLLLPCLPTARDKPGLQIRLCLDREVVGILSE